VVAKVRESGLPRDGLEWTQAPLFIAETVPRPRAVSSGHGPVGRSSLSSLMSFVQILPITPRGDSPRPVVNA
jgi:hypothetical protein